MDTPVKKNLTTAEHWLRAVYVVLFLVCIRLASMLMGLIALCQIVFTLITGEPNGRLVTFGYSLARFIYSANLFVCSKSEAKPFPFTDWPSNEESINEAPIKDDNSKPILDAEESVQKPSLDAADCNDGVQK